MNRITLITGGAASGKSRYARERAGAFGPNVLFIATCIPRDDEMKAKVRRHRAERPGSWHTEERARDVAGALTPACDAAIVDCLTLLVSQFLVDGVAEAEILAEVALLFDPPPCPLFVVTNEVGWGIVPESALGRRFREVAGTVNGLAAGRADEVVLMVSGLPVRIKGVER